MWSSCSFSSPMSISRAELDRRGAVDDAEGDAHVAVAAEDRLRHQQLVEVRVEHRADDRIDLPGVIVDAGGDVGHGLPVSDPPGHDTMVSAFQRCPPRCQTREGLAPSYFRQHLRPVPVALGDAAGNVLLPVLLHRGVVVEVELAVDDAPGARDRPWPCSPPTPPRRNSRRIAARRPAGWPRRPPCCRPRRSARWRRSRSARGRGLPFTGLPALK